MSSSAKKEAILRDFRQLTRATPQDAHRILKAHGYRLEAATNAFFSDEQAQLNALASSSTLDKKTEREVTQRLNTLFDRFRAAAEEDDDDDDEDAEANGARAAEDPDVMSIGGALKMCEALEVSPEDVVFLPLSFYLRSPSIGTFTRTDYVAGWKMLDLSDTLEKQKKTIEKLRQELLENKPLRLERVAQEKADPATASSANKGLYEKVYEYTYAFARQEGQKSLALENALAFWDLILPASPTFKKEGSDGTFTQHQLDLWKKFLSEHTGGRAISKDTWTQFLDFTREINADFSNHDFDGKHPCPPQLIEGYLLMLFVPRHLQRLGHRSSTTLSCGPRTTWQPTAWTQVDPRRLPHPTSVSDHATLTCAKIQQHQSRSVQRQASQSHMQVRGAIEEKKVIGSGVENYMSPLRTKGMPIPESRALAFSDAFRPRWFVMQSIWNPSGRFGYWSRLISICGNSGMASGCMPRLTTPLMAAGDAGGCDAGGSGNPAKLLSLGRTKVESTSRNSCATGPGRIALTPTGMPGRSLKLATPDLARMISMRPRDAPEPDAGDAAATSDGSDRLPSTDSPVMARIWAMSGTKACLLAIASFEKHVRITFSSRGICVTVFCTGSGLVSGCRRRLPRAGR